MNTNTSLVLALAACLSIPSTHLLAEGAPVTSDSDVMYPSEQQLEQKEHKMGNLQSVDEPLKPSKHQKVQKKHKKANSNVPATSVSDDVIKPSEQKLEQEEQKEEHKEEQIMEEIEPGKTPAK
jgi:hypothetical protein